MNSINSANWLAYVVTAPDTFLCACSSTRETAVADLLKELRTRYPQKSFSEKDICTRFLSTGDVFEID